MRPFGAFAGTASLKPSARLFAGQHQLTLSVLCLAIIFMAVSFPWLMTNLDPTVGSPTARFLAPGAHHWFGTDYLGRDVYAREVYGAFQTLRGAAIAVAIGASIGSLLGLMAGTGGVLAEVLIMRLADTLLAIPGLLMALCIVASFGPSAAGVSIGVGIASIAPFVRLMRAEVLRVRQSDYVEAAAISGSGHWRTLFVHILPNSAGPVLSLIAVEFGAAILAIAALGFLGYGTPPPTPEWGTMIAEGRRYLGTAWWLTTIPGLVIVLVVLSFQRVSRFLLAFNRF
jgi:peptide/nickel transport system permease protein